MKLARAGIHGRLQLAQEDQSPRSEVSLSRNFIIRQTESRKGRMSGILREATPILGETWHGVGGEREEKRRGGFSRRRELPRRRKNRRSRVDGEKDQRGKEGSRTQESSRKGGERERGRNRVRKTTVRR